MTDEDFETRLENWARWCCANKVVGQCESLEHFYRSPQEWHLPPPPVIPRGPIDRLDALEVLRAWRHVPQPYKTVLKDWYVLRRDPKRTCGRLYLAFSAHLEYLARARLMCRNLLRTAEIC